MVGLLWTIITILFVFWLLGFLLHFGGGLIHLILLVVVILIVVNLITGRGAAGLTRRCRRVRRATRKKSAPARKKGEEHRVRRAPGESTRAP